MIIVRETRQRTEMYILTMHEELCLSYYDINKQALNEKVSKHTESQEQSCKYRRTTKSCRDIIDITTINTRINMGIENGKGITTNKS